MSTFVDSLVVGRVIGEVVDLFVPTVTMSITYGPTNVNNGCTVKPSKAIDPPMIQISGKRKDLYTLVMIDPDAPSPSDPTMREWLHWVVVDIPGGTEPTKGKELLSYSAPRPPVGIHRFVFVLFQQKEAFPAVEPPLVSRANFKTRSFATKYDLGLPVATIFFNAQKEPMHKRQRRSNREENRTQS